MINDEVFLMFYLLFILGAGLQYLGEYPGRLGQPGFALVCHSLIWLGLVGQGAGRVDLHFSNEHAGDQVFGTEYLIRCADFQLMSILPS